MHSVIIVSIACMNNTHITLLCCVLTQKEELPSLSFRLSIPGLTNTELPSSLPPPQYVPGPSLISLPTARGTASPGKTITLLSTILLEYTRVQLFIGGPWRGSSVVESSRVIGLVGLAHACVGDY